MITLNVDTETHNFSDSWMGQRVFSQENTWKSPMNKSVILKTEVDLIWYVAEGIKSKLKNKNKNLWSIVKV